MKHPIPVTVPETDRASLQTFIHAGKAVELGFVESISPETIRQLLKKMNSSPGNTSSGASQP